jgi:hypothetical protein
MQGKKCLMDETAPLARKFDEGVKVGEELFSEVII